MKSIAIISIHQECLPLGTWPALLQQLGLILTPSSGNDGRNYEDADPKTKIRNTTDTISGDLYLCIMGLTN